MKIKQNAFIACIISLTAISSLSAQTTTQAETPSWVIKQSKEYVAKFKDELKLTPADSAIFTDEFISRTLRTSAACKIASTPEEKKEAASVCTKEYFENLKKKISPVLYNKYMTFLNRSQKK